MIPKAQQKKDRAVHGHLYYGDNLDVLRKHIPDESVDLVYLDPPFNSKADYNILFREPTGEPSEAQVTAFEDTWHWTEETEREYHEIIEVPFIPARLKEALAALRRFLDVGQKGNDMMAYLTRMAIRLVELRRVLKPTGTLYLHCDPKASHYLKVILDSIFGPKNFINEIVWCYRGGGTPKKDFPRRHDIILRYSKTDLYEFHPDPVRVPYQAEGLGRTDDAMWGKHKGTDKVYKPHPLGKVPEDWWLINPLNANDPERLSYPTQKPEALLERILLASSAEGDTVLDPFCGCGTTVAVAQRLRRNWIGIDVTHLAINVMKRRLKDAFGLDAYHDYRVTGEPTDLAGAQALAAQNRYQFQWWALSLINAIPYGEKKKGADTGIDGFLYFFENKSDVRKVIVSVKSGKVTVEHIRQLAHVTDREEAVMGLFITLEDPTHAMVTEAVKQGYYKIQSTNFPKIQIITVEDLLAGARPKLPVLVVSPYKAARPKAVGQADIESWANEKE